MSDDDSMSPDDRVLSDLSTNVKSNTKYSQLASNNMPSINNNGNKLHEKTNRPVTMREKARMQEIENIEEELSRLDDSFPLARRILELEIHRIRGGIADTIDIVGNKKAKIRSKVLIPTDQIPGYNFVGKLLGRGGATLKKLQEDTSTKMAILGSGSMRNEQKEVDLLESGDIKYQHLKQTLHLQVDCLASPEEAYYRISHALTEVKKIMTPDPGELAALYAEQNHCQNLNGGGPQNMNIGHMRGRGRGGSFGPPMPYNGSGPPMMPHMLGPPIGHAMRGRPGYLNRGRPGIRNGRGGMMNGANYGGNYGPGAGRGAYPYPFM